MSNPILITGARGLIGAALSQQLGKRNVEVRAFDLSEGDDICDRAAVADAIAACRGVVHLGAVSRVVWGEQRPEECHTTNVEGTRNVLQAAQAATSCSWAIIASSREVYGQPDKMPVTEDTPLRPINVYGHSKVAGEHLAQEACAAGLRTAVIRLSNVYGSVADHPDRVVPAFVCAALQGANLQIEGAGHTFDFVYIDDVTQGLITLVDLLDGGDLPPPIQLVTGVPTTLGYLADMAIELTNSKAKAVEAPQRSFDASHFYGDPSRALELLDWRAQTPLMVGLKHMIGDFQALTHP